MPPPPLLAVPKPTVGRPPRPLPAVVKPTKIKPPTNDPGFMVKPSPPYGLKRALLVGINYVGTQYALAGCINDVKNMQTQLQSYFPMCKEYTMITDETSVKPTRANILAAIDALVSGLKAGENVYVHYSGHGGQVRDTNGDEVSGFDSCIYPVAGTVMETITDDELRARLASKIPAGCKCFVVLDCCHSGSAVDLRYTWQAPTAGAISYIEDKKYAKVPGTIIFLSGCHDKQVAMDTVCKDDKPCGALTMALLDTWRTYGPAIKTKYILWDVRKFLRENGYSQIPQLCSGDYYDMNKVFDLGC
jgi:metacaspase-1